MAHYLDPKNDLTFKRIFGEHKHLCLSLLNSMLPLDAAQQIVSLEYKPSEQAPEIPGLKNTIVDVCCIDNRGRQFIVEMQMQWTDSFKSRVLLNAAKAYVRQLGKGKEYALLQPVYALSFVDDTFDHATTAHYHDYKLVNVANTEKQIEGLELVFIELPKFVPTNRAEKRLYDLWLTFLTKIKDNQQEVPSELLEETVTKEAVDLLEQNSYSENELAAYDRYWDTVSTARTVHVDARKEGEAEGEAIGLEKGEAIGLEKGEAIGLEKGEAIGLEKGEAIGLEKGEAIGLEKGEAIGLEKGREEAFVEIVLAGSRDGFSPEQLQAITGFSRERIEKILADGKQQQ